ncbi:GNAT family N-acetyltransferase [Streptomyces sp. NPDC056930]|uniref:GNAT family N-acetyltransferase n=1 Tax=Streptomyces sp. NPDC056930 TaxID=3345967 RepID=UPI0036315147
MGFWPRSLSALRERVERDSDDQDRDDFLVLLSAGTPIGHIALVDQDIANGTAEVHLLLDSRYRGQGYGTDALDALVDLAFGELPMHRIQAVTHTANTAALTVLTKAGFCSCCPRATHAVQAQANSPTAIPPPNNSATTKPLSASPTSTTSAASPFTGVRTGQTLFGHLRWRYHRVHHEGGRDHRRTCGSASRGGRRAGRRRVGLQEELHPRSGQVAQPGCCCETPRDHRGERHRLGSGHCLAAQWSRLRCTAGYRRA